MAVAATQLGMINPAAAQRTETKVPAIKPGTNTSFGPLKQIDAGVLSVGYAEAGPVNGPVVILLHGWPYDIYAFVDVASLLASAGYRVIVPNVRGYGTTAIPIGSLAWAAARRRSHSLMTAQEKILRNETDNETDIDRGRLIVAHTFAGKIISK